MSVSTMSRFGFDSSWTPPSPPPDTSGHEDESSSLPDSDTDVPSACEHHDDSDTLFHPSSSLDGSSEVADDVKPAYRLQDPIDELDVDLKNLCISTDGALEEFGGASKRPHSNQLPAHDHAKRAHTLQNIVILPHQNEAGFSNVTSPLFFPRMDNRFHVSADSQAETLPSSVDTDGAEAQKEISRIKAEIIAYGEAMSLPSLGMTSRGAGQQSPLGFTPDFRQLSANSPTRVTGIAAPPTVTRSSSLHQKTASLSPTYKPGSLSRHRPSNHLLLSQTGVCNPPEFGAVSTKADTASRTGRLPASFSACNPPPLMTRTRNYSESSTGSLSPSEVTLKNHPPSSVAQSPSDRTVRNPASQLWSSFQDVRFTCGNYDGEDDRNAEECLPQDSFASHLLRNPSVEFSSSGSSSHSGSSASLSSEYSGSSGSARNSGMELNFQRTLSELGGSNCSIASACSSQQDSGIGDSPMQSPSGPPLPLIHACSETRNSMGGISQEMSGEAFSQHCTPGPMRRSLSSSSDKSSASSTVTSKGFREPHGSEGRICMTVCSPPSYAQGFKSQQSPDATSPAQYNLPPTPVSPDGNASSPSTVQSLNSPNSCFPEASSPNAPNTSSITPSSISNHTTVTNPPSISASLRTISSQHSGIQTPSPMTVTAHVSPHSQSSPGDRQMVLGNSQYSPTVTARSPQCPVEMASSPHGSVGVANSPCVSVVMVNSPAHSRTGVNSPTYPPAVSPSHIANSPRVDPQMVNFSRVNSPPVNPPQMNSPLANFQEMNSRMVSSTTSPQRMLDYSSMDPDTERCSESPITDSYCWSSPATPEIVQELSPEQLERRVIGEDGKWICDMHGETYLHALPGLDDEDMATNHVFSLCGKGQFNQALNAYNNAFETPLYSAVIFNKPKLTTAFIQVGADVNCQCQTGMHDIQHTPLHRAVDEGQVDIVQILLDSDHIDINAKRRPDNQTPLMVALKKHVRGHRSNDRSQVIDMLLKAGPDLECKELTHQKTALMMAIETKDVDVVQLILGSAGVENTRRLINQDKTGSGNTAMHVAAGHNIPPQIQSKMLRLLILFGGDTDVKNNEGATPKDYAKKAIEEVSTRR